MKLLSKVETAQIGGGTVFPVNGRYVSVDTWGIPEHCTHRFVTMTQDIASASNQYNASFSSVLEILGRHLDAIDNAGCTYYLETFSNRLENAIGY